MREVALTVDLLGLDASMSRATADWQQKIGDQALRATADEAADYRLLADRILARLVGDEEDRPAGPLRRRATFGRLRLTSRHNWEIRRRQDRPVAAAREETNDFETLDARRRPLRRPLRRSGAR